jgi:hypothetical protein
VRKGIVRRAKNWSTRIFRVGFQISPTNQRFRFPGMDYRIRHNKAELDSTGYMEIGPGRYTGSHWQDGFIFVWEDM